MGNSRQKKIVKIIINIIFIIAIVFLIKFAVEKVFDISKSGMQGMLSQTKELDYTNTVEIEIPEGASTTKIANILKENKLISSTLLFRYQSRKDGYDGTYRFGKYEIPVGADYKVITEILQKGTKKEDFIKITIPEGYTIKKMAELLEEKGIGTAESFILAANKNDYDFDFIKDIPERENLLEGYLFPDTYLIDEEFTSEDVVKVMLKRFDSFYTDELRQAVKSRGMTLDNIVIIASMVESEIMVADERPVAAGVIYNRLEIGMPLQIDSTVQYALGTRNEQVTYKDLEVDSPYNTYKNTGLPYGPISNPGEAALLAAINPDDNNYLYYVVEAGGNGSHVYTESYEDFLKAKAAYKNQ